MTRLVRAAAELAAGLVLVCTCVRIGVWALPRPSAAFSCSRRRGVAKVLRVVWAAGAGLVKGSWASGTGERGTTVSRGLRGGWCTPEESRPSALRARLDCGAGLAVWESWGTVGMVHGTPSEGECAGGSSSTVAACIRHRAFPQIGPQIGSHRSAQHPGPTTPLERTECRLDTRSDTRR